MEKLSKCDFKPMFEHFEREKEKKKTMTKEEKKQSVLNIPLAKLLEGIN